MVAFLCVCSPLWIVSASSAQAQEILVVSGDQVPDDWSEVVSDALGDAGSVMSPSSYTAKLRGRGQEPDSEEALTKVAPQTGASLVVVLEHARNRLKVQLRNGYTGSVVGHTTVPARGKRAKLGKPAKKRLVAAAKRALKKIGPAPSRRPQSTDDFADDAAPEQPARAASTPTRQPSRPAAPLAQAEPEEDEEDEEDESPQAEDTSEASFEDEAPPHEAAAKSSAQGILFRLHAGLGLGSRSIVVPTPPGRGIGNKVDTSFVPALDIGAALEVPLGPEWLLRVLADYRTIFGLSAGYLTPMGMMATSGLSSHSVIAGASLGHLSDGRDSFGVHVFLGWAYRGLSAEQPNLPSASIQGVVLRPELEIPIADRKFTLRLAPELILILAPSATLPANDSALAKAVGFAIGAEVSADWHISQTFGLSVQFRESRGSTPSGWGTSAIENERYLSLRLLLQL